MGSTNAISFRGIDKVTLDNFKKECDLKGINYGSAITQALILWQNRGQLKMMERYGTTVKKRKINVLNKKDLSKTELEEYMMDGCEP